MNKYNNTEEIKFNGIRTRGTFNPPSFLNSDNLKSAEIAKIEMEHKYVGNPSLIAYDYYGDVNLDWVVILFDMNKVTEVFGWPKMENRIIYLPSRSTIKKLGY